MYHCLIQIYACNLFYFTIYEEFFVQHREAGGGLCASVTSLLTANAAIQIFISFFQ